MFYCPSDSENIEELIYFFADDFSWVWPETAAMRTKRTRVEKWNDVLIDGFPLFPPSCVQHLSVDENDRIPFIALL